MSCAQEGGQLPRHQLPPLPPPGAAPAPPEPAAPACPRLPLSHLPLPNQPGSFVFEGKPPELKREELNKRSSKKAEATVELEVSGGRLRRLELFLYVRRWCARV